MDEVLKFLLIAAVIVIGIVRQLKKEAKKNADKVPTMPTPETGNPLPENWGGGTYGGYIPEGPQQEPPIQVKKKKTTSTPKPFLSSTTSSTTQIASPPASSLQEPDESAESEFTIHSAEEARRAIIWSEILQRKY